MILQELVLKELLGGLWHTTHPDRFEQILRTGAIEPEPNIPDRERWGTAAGKDGWPYVRTIGGVSLFDFDNFDEKSYEERCPLSSWSYFVPCHLDWKCAVWIEIERERIAANSVSGDALWQRRE